MKVTYTELPRGEVIAALGPHWPPRPGATVARIRAAITHGAVAVHGVNAKPGCTWWVVDGLVVTQDAGPAPELPAASFETVPQPVVDAPPLT